MKRIIVVGVLLFVAGAAAYAQMPDDKPRIDDHFQRWRIHMRIDLKEKMNMHLQVAYNQKYYQNTVAEYEVEENLYNERYSTKGFKYRQGLVDALLKALLDPASPIKKVYESGKLNKPIKKDEVRTWLTKNVDIFKEGGDEGGE